MNDYDEIDKNKNLDEGMRENEISIFIVSVLLSMLIVGLGLFVY
jgi:tetrahydromethanopterin S-methyltransferase subunit F